MRLPQTLVALIFGLISAAALAKSPEVYRAPGTGQLTIGADGSVLDVHLDQSFGKAVDVGLTRKMSSWRFQPIVENGKPVEAVAHFRLTLQADLSKGDNGGLRIVQADFVDPPVEINVRKLHHMTPPSYPRRPLGEHYGAEIELIIRFDGQGVVQDVAADSGWLTGPPARDSRLRTHYQSFVDAAIKAAKHWQFAEVAATGQFVVRAPVNFFIESDGPWRRSHRIDVVPAPWVVAHEAESITELGADGEPLSKRIRLLSELDG